MSKVKVVAAIVLIVMVAILAASGAARVELNQFLDLGIGAGALIAAVVAIFKEK